MQELVATRAFLSGSDPIRGHKHARACRAGAPFAHSFDASGRGFSRHVYGGMCFVIFPVEGAPSLVAMPLMSGARSATDFSARFAYCVPKSAARALSLRSFQESRIVEWMMSTSGSNGEAITWATFLSVCQPISVGPKDLTTKYLGLRTIRLLGDKRAKRDAQERARMTSTARRYFASKTIRFLLQLPICVAPSYL